MEPSSHGAIRQQREVVHLEGNRFRASSFQLQAANFTDGHARPGKLGEGRVEGGVGGGEKVAGGTSWTDIGNVRANGKGSKKG